MVALQSSPLLASSSRPLPSLSDQPTTFELVGARVVSGRFAGIVISLYRPGSAAVLQSFFDELAAVLETVSPHTRSRCTSSATTTSGSTARTLDRPDDPHAIQLRQLVELYGLLLHDTLSTH